jgi:26S proteasome regulatory subunit T5
VSRTIQVFIMSTLEDLDDLEHDGGDERKDQNVKAGNKSEHVADSEMQDAHLEQNNQNSTEELIDTEILHSSTRDIITRRRLLDNEMRIMKSDFQRLTHEQGAMKEKIKDNLDKIENNR